MKVIKVVGSNSILCQKCWVHKGCTRIKGRLKHDKFKYWACASQETVTAKERPGIESDCQSLEKMENSAS